MVGSDLGLGDLLVNRIIFSKNLKSRIVLGKQKIFLSHFIGSSPDGNFYSSVARKFEEKLAKF